MLRWMVSALLLRIPARRFESGLSTVEASTSVRLAAPPPTRKRRRRTCPITTTTSPAATAGGRLGPSQATGTLTTPSANLVVASEVISPSPEGDPPLGVAGERAVEDSDVHDASFVSARADLGGAP